MEDFQKNEFLKKNVTTFVITYNEWLSDTVKNDQSETKVFRWDGYIHEQLNFVQNKKTKDEIVDENNENSAYYLNFYHWIVLLEKKKKWKTFISSLYKKYIFQILN